MPESLAELSQLHELDLSGNQITDLPAELAQLEHLRELRLQNNSLNPELAAAYKLGLGAVKEYLQAKVEGQVVLNEAKLVLVGEGEVGKSCLLGALRGDSWVKGRPTTHGIQIKPVAVTNRDNIEIALNGWDFGGQPVYRPTHQLFFSAPAIYLVVWKPREGPQQGFVKEWITLIKHRAPEAKVLVVATHGGPKQRQPDIDRQELIDQFGKDTICDFFFVDSKPDSNTGECNGINALKEKIAEVATALPGVGRTIPAKWYRVREVWQATGQPYLSYERAIALCEEQGIQGFLAELCIRVYHTLGNIVHYHNDSLLKDIVILKPDWLAKAISFVLDDEETRRRNGLVEFERLSQLWSNPPYEGEQGYPPELHPIFLRLMERFDLSYKVVLDPPPAEANRTSLITQLVPNNRPASLPWSSQVETGEREQTQVCRIVDDRGQLANAEGLFYQLIVRLHKYSLGRDNYDKSVHWQRGLMLDDDYNGRALLEHVGTNVRITVRAAYPEFFLHQLTREVKWLVENFWKGLRCEIVVPCIDPCGKNQPGLGEFEVEKLIASRRDNRREFPCPVSGCDKWQNIDNLMRNTPTAQSSLPIISGEQAVADIMAELKQIRQNQSKLSQNQKAILSQVNQSFAETMQVFADEAKEGPRLFSLTPLEPGLFDPLKWVNARFQLTLWCEHSHLPLPSLNPEDPKGGVYELNFLREWFVKVAPYLKTVMTAVKLVLPVPISAAQLVLGDAEYQKIAEEIDLGQKAIDFSARSSGMAMDWLGQSDARGLEQDDSTVIRARGSMLRSLHTLLKEKDPSFGGLVRVQNKRREFLWVHPQYASDSDYS